ncbi:hypothetical protein CY35_05G086000 [Sphagnum magellanicum]|nr:hypothetical protein CY35_05G086000 [Sphagnum magellanicum]
MENLRSDALPIDDESGLLLDPDFGNGVAGPIVRSELSPRRRSRQGGGGGGGLDAWCLPPLPVFDEVTQCFAQSASNLSRHLANLVGESAARDALRSPSEPSSRIASIETSTSSSAVVPLSEASSSGAAESSSLLSNLGIEWPAAIFATTGSTVMAMGQHVLSTPAVWNSFVSRVQTTLRGSADDIGWLQRLPDSSPVEDCTPDFLQALDTISHGVHLLPNNLTYLLIPGLFSNHGPLYFVDTKKYFSKLGLSCHIAKIHSEAAVEINARELKRYIEELYWGAQKKVVLLGHSKGGLDAAAACSMFWEDLKDKVVGLAVLQCPYGGSPIAADILREGQIADTGTRRLMEVLICKLIKGDMQALEDLTYDKRRKFLAKYTFPHDLPTLSFHTEASRSPGWISTMSHIAHAELPWLPGSNADLGRSSDVGGARVPVAIPLAAAMAVCALHLELRYGEKSDGLVTRKDAEIPGSIVVRPEKKLDHGWMVFSQQSVVNRKDPFELDAPKMCEALLTLLLNHDKWRRSDSQLTPEAAAAVKDAHACAVSMKQD